MKLIRRIIFAAAAALISAACVPASQVELGVDQTSIQVGAEGGRRTVQVTAPGSWVAMTESPWITISPANGRGSQECTISIDTTLVFGQRTGAVRIQSLDDSDDKKDFEIIQNGYDYQLTLKETEKNVEDYAGYDDRHF